MNKVVSWIKTHPMLTGAIVIVAGLAAYLVLSSRGGGTTYVDGGSTGPSDAQLAAQAQINMAQLAAGVQSAGIAAGIQMAQIQGQTDIALADRSLEAALAQIVAATSTTNAQTQAARDVQLASLQAQVAMGAQQQHTYETMALLMAKPKTIKTLGKYGWFLPPSTSAGGNAPNLIS